jgi:hypothetical protein
MDLLESLGKGLHAVAAAAGGGPGLGEAALAE